MTITPLSLRHFVQRAAHRCMRRMSTVPQRDGCGVATRSTRPWREEATLYIHWPYCSKRCHYCNFNKYISNSIDHARMRDCLAREARNLIALSGVRRIKSIFFGGGTPSLAEPRTLASVVESVRGQVDLAEDTEITMEANPTSSEAGRLADFKSAGINRLSLGIQSFNDSHLKFLGRNHSSENALKVLEDAKKLFPGRVSLDLIFGIPRQTLEDWGTDLERALDVCDKHISLYQLTLERGTPLFRMQKRGEISVLDTDVTADMYSHAVSRLSQAGFSRYEISNFSKGNSAASIHNQSYWSGGQYIGVGPGAHGRFALASGQGCSGSVKAFREARIQALDPSSWIEEVETIGQGTRKRVELSKLDVLKELLMMGLRTSKGVQNDEIWTDLTDGESLEAVFHDSNTVSTLCKEGYLEVTEKFMRATDRGLIILDSIIPDIINELNVYFEWKLSESKSSP